MLQAHPVPQSLEQQLSSYARRHMSRVAPPGKEELAGSLPHFLYEELCREAFTPVVSGHSLLHSLCSKYTAFQRELCVRCFVEWHVMAQETLFLPGGQCESLLFVVRGVITYSKARLPPVTGSISNAAWAQILPSSVPEVTEVSSLSEGDWLCEHCLWTTWNYLGQARADSGADMLCLSRGERYLDRIAFSPKGQHSKGEVAEAKVLDDGLEIRWKGDPQIGDDPSYFSSGFLRMYAPVAGKVLQGDKHHPCNVDFHWLRGYSGFADAPAPDVSVKKLWKNQGVADQIQHRDYHAARNSDSANLELMQAVMEHGVVILDNVPPSQDSSVLLDFVNNCLGGMQKDPARDDPNWVIKRKAAALRVSYAQERRLNNHTDQSVPAHGIPALLLVVNLCFFPQDTKHGAFR